MYAKYECKSVCLFQLQTFYDEQTKYMKMFDMMNKLMLCHMQSFMSAPRLPDRSSKNLLICLHSTTLINYDGVSSSL